MICMLSIGLLYTLDIVSFLEIISDNVYIPKKQMSVMLREFVPKGLM